MRVLAPLTWFRDWACRALVCCLVACGGGSGGDGTPSASRPESIVFGPNSVALAVGQKLFLEARARYANGSSLAVNIIGTWQSSNPTVATIDGVTGTVSALSEGTTVISATYQGVTGSYPIQVGSVLLYLDMIIPRALGVGIGAEYKARVLGQYTDRRVEVTDLALWTSSQLSLAAVSNAVGTRGVVRGIAAGKATITAAIGNISHSFDIEILPMQAVDAGVFPLAPLSAAVGIDGAGNAVAFWGRGAPYLTELNFAVGTPATGWGLKRPLSRNETGRPMRDQQLAVADDGSALASWTELDGLWAAHYSPTTGWLEPTHVSAFPSLGFALATSLAIDARGNGMLVWQSQGEGAGYLASTYLRVTGQWSAPVAIPGSAAANTKSFHFRLAVGASGHAVLAWESLANLPPSPNALPGPDLVLVSRYVPGSDVAAGWQPAKTLITTYSGSTRLAVAVNKGGETLVAWTTNGTDSPTLPLARPYRVASQVFQPATGWQDVRLLVDASTRSPEQPQAALNSSGAAVLVWTNTYDNTVESALRSNDGAWSAPRQLYGPANANLAGSVQVVKPCVTEDGQAVLSWLPDERLLTTRYVPATGWAVTTLWPYVGRLGSVSAFDQRFNAACKSSLLWLESNGSAYVEYAYLLTP